MTSSPPGGAEPAWVVIGRGGTGVGVVELDANGSTLRRTEIAEAELCARVQELEGRFSPRWVWNDTPRWYDALLVAGARVGRAHDLRLVHTILRDAAGVIDDTGLRAAGAWDAAAAATDQDTVPALFELDELVRGGRESTDGLPGDVEDALAEFARQRAALAAASSGRLRLLVAAESAGALVAAEMRAAGLPWDVARHDAVLREVLGERGSDGQPAHLGALAREVRTALADPSLSLDSQPKLLRALHRAGVFVESTGRWELARHDHPVVRPLIAYKRLQRLYTANGWAWLDEWVRDGRFRPVYVPGGVVTGRWASSGGGALQIPRQVRRAVRADPGWRLVVADVAQLEPRVLAAMAGDTRLADAARGRDLYEGIVIGGVVATRAEAKLALLGAMYGATTGDSGRLVPRLRQTFPRAMRLVDDAARAGEEGAVVSTWLGRSSPPPSAAWNETQSRASDPDASEADQARARRSARDRGRFTRNFVVQGTAAEWALAWLADLRGRLAAIDPVGDEDAAPRSGAAFARKPHLAFFLHDEIIVHTPAARADEAVDAVRAAADAATRLLFGDFPLDFRLDLRIAESAEKS